MRYSVPSCKSATLQGFHSGIPVGTIARLTGVECYGLIGEHPKDEDGHSGSLVADA